jgi:hypothetical protein
MKVWSSRQRRQHEQKKHGLYVQGVSSTGQSINSEDDWNVTKAQITAEYKTIKR